MAEALDRVLEILRTTELYSPQLGTKDEDPHTSDLVGGLMTVSKDEITISRVMHYGSVICYHKQLKQNCNVSLFHLNILAYIPRCSKTQLYLSLLHAFILI